MILRCTVKTLRLLGLEVAAASQPAANEDDWYLNLLWVDRRKCLILTHAGTLFSAFAADVRVAELRPISTYAVKLVEAELHSEGLPLDCLGPLDQDAVEVARTADRSVLAFMNDLVFQARYAVADAGSLDAADIAEINFRLRRNLNSNRRASSYSTPLERISERLSASRSL
jgi:hypothetical protein